MTFEKRWVKSSSQGIMRLLSCKSPVPSIYTQKPPGCFISGGHASHFHSISFRRKEEKQIEHLNEILEPFSLDQGRGYIVREETGYLSEQNGGKNHLSERPLSSEFCRLPFPERLDKSNNDAWKVYCKGAQQHHSIPLLGPFRWDEDTTGWERIGWLNR